jgi:uncharacterized protein (DUF433 family)
LHKATAIFSYTLVMALTIEPETFPLTIDSDKMIRVGGTRVTLDTVVYSFKDGATAEEIALRYPALTLTDVYAAITYYLRHQSEVEVYLKERKDQATQLQQEIEQRFNPVGIRERLLARQRNT